MPDLLQKEGMQVQAPIYTHTVITLKSGNLPIVSKLMKWLETLFAAMWGYSLSFIHTLGQDFL